MGICSRLTPGKPRSWHIQREHLAFFRQGLKDMAPTERVAEQAMNQNQSRAVASPFEAHFKSIHDTGLFGLNWHSVSISYH